MAKKFRTIKQRKDFYREFGESYRILQRDAKNTALDANSTARKAIAESLLTILPKSFVGATKALTRKTEGKGELFYDLRKVVKNLDDAVLSDGRVYNIMIDIKNRAKELAPVDKRYLRAEPINKKKKSYTLPAFSNLKERERGFDFSMFDAIRKRRTKGGAFLHSEAVASRADMMSIAEKIRKGEELSDAEKISLMAKTSFQQINMPDNRYSAEAQNYIYNVLKGNRRAERRYLWFDKSSESINRYNINHKKKGNRNKVIGTPFTDEQAEGRRSGGEEELRRSGDYDKKNFMVYFDTTKFTKEKYNYAAIQHERLDFVHWEGQSHFLRTAILQHRKMLIETLNNVAMEKMVSKSSTKKVIGPKDIKEVKRIQIASKNKNDNIITSSIQRKLVEKTSKKLKKAADIERRAKIIKKEMDKMKNK
jgi:hypothetical protein